MRKHILQVLLLASLAVLPVLGHAGPEDRNRQGWSGLDSLQWRLGGARGWQGHEIYYRYPGDRQWRRAPGEARDVGDGWVIGTDRRNGGFGIYRWNGRNWSRMPGAGIDIGGSYNNPWVINDRGERFTWSGYGWREDNSFRRGRDERQFQPPRRDDRRDQDRDRRDGDRDGRNRR